MTNQTHIQMMSLAHASNKMLQSASIAADVNQRTHLPPQLAKKVKDHQAQAVSLSRQIHAYQRRFPDGQR